MFNRADHRTLVRVIASAFCLWGLIFGFTAYPMALQAAPPAGFGPTFTDEFNTASLDPTCSTNGTWATYWCKWNTRRLYDNSDDGVKTHDDWKGINGGAKTLKQVLAEAGWPNPSLHEVSNGTLKMRTYPIPAAYHTQFDWYGAKPPSAASMISTERSFSQQYGYFEIRAKLNSTPKNNHYSLWLLPTDNTWPPEIDLLETVIDVNNQGAGILSSANSHGETPDLPITFFKPQGGMAGIWHTYGFLWTPTEMTWFVDGVKVRSHANYINKPMYVLGSWEVGGNWVGNIDADTPWPQEMEIDYVRVYKEGAPVASSCAMLFPSGSSPYTGFGASWNLFSANKELLLAASCKDTSVEISAGRAGAPLYVYKNGYRWDGKSWAPFVYTGATPQGEWLAGMAQASIPKTPGATIFLGYACQYIENTWKCGCSDSACQTPKWQLQGVQE